MHSMSSRRYGLHDLAKFFWLTKKPETLTDRRAVVLLKVDRTVVRHAPRDFSRVFWHFLACAKQIIPTTGKEACA